MLGGQFARSNTVGNANPAVRVAGQGEATELLDSLVDQRTELGVVDDLVASDEGGTATEATEVFDVQGVVGLHDRSRPSDGDSLSWYHRP